MSSRHANSLRVEFENGTRSSTLMFFSRSCLGSSHRIYLSTLAPPSPPPSPPPSDKNVKVPPNSYVHTFVYGTNEFIDVEEMKNQEGVENDPGSSRRRRGANEGIYELIDVQIDSDILFNYRRIRVVDSKAAPSGAEASSRKKFELETEPRAVQNETGWILWLVMTLYAFTKYAIIGLMYVFNGLKHVINGFRIWIPAIQPATPVSKPPVEDPDASRV